MLNQVGESLYGRKEKPSVAGIIINVVLVIFTLVLVWEVVFNTLYTGIYVINISMTPTLHGATISGYNADGTPIADIDGDYVYIRNGAKPDYGDVVVIYWADRKENIIKRAVAFGGDELWFKEGWLYLKRKGEDKAEKQEEPYISDQYRTDYSHPEYYNFYSEDNPYTVKEGCVFALGDNRNHSDDSRGYGDFPLKNVLGVVPKWSIKNKSISTAWHKFFYFTLRGKKTAEIPAENPLYTA